jgi:cytoskeleton protein RodZ
MSDESVLVPPPVAAEGVAAVSAGALLRQAREATGLHVAALAVAMKVPVKKLEALEADRLGDLPDAVFVRALAASVCRTLKIDPAPILSRLPQSAVPKLNSHERGLNTPVSKPRVLVMPSLLAVVAKPSVLLVGVILLAVLAVLVVPEARNSLGTGIATPPAAEPVMPPADTIPPPTTSTEVAQAAPQAPAPVAVPDTPTTPAAPVAVPAVAPMAAPVLAAAPVPAAAASAATATAGTVVAANAPTPSGLLVFKASASSWLRVSDSKGSVLFEKTLQAGEAAAVNGSGTLSVVVGNVAGTEVLLHGKPFQMVDLNQNNVARFEVK